MFNKLLKHEMKATAGSLGMFSVAAIVIGITGGFMLRYLISAAFSNRSDTFSVVFSVLLMFMVLGLFAYAFGSEFFLLYQFYKRKFSDEGYLTFTLPARSWQIFLSSVVNVFVWMVVIGLVIVAAFAGFLGIGIVGTPLWNQMDFGGFKFPQMSDLLSRTTPVMILCTVSQFFSSIVVILTCITIGSVLAKKHKILAAIGVYYVWSLVFGMISTRMMESVLVSTLETELITAYSIQTGLAVAVAIAGFLLSCQLMNRKLNLP